MHGESLTQGPKPWREESKSRPKPTFSPTRPKLKPSPRPAAGVTTQAFPQPPTATPAARGHPEPPPCHLLPLPNSPCSAQSTDLLRSVVVAHAYRMQTVRSAVLQHLRLRAASAIAAARGGSGRPAMYGFARGLSAPPAGQEDGRSGSSDTERDITTRVVNLVKKFDKIDADKVGCCLCSLFSSSPLPLPFFLGS